MAVNMMGGYPDWVNQWAQHYGIDPGTLWSNVQLGNSQAVDPQQYPGADINAQTGRRWIDAWQDPNGTPQSDLATVGQWQQAPESMQHGPNNFMERLASYSPYIIAAMGAGAGAEYLMAPEAFGAGAAGSGVGTLSASSLPASAGVTGSELGMLGGGTTASGIGTLSASSLPATAGVTGTELGIYGGAGAAGLSGAGNMMGPPSSAAVDYGMGPPSEYANNFNMGPPSDYAGGVPRANGSPNISWQDLLGKLGGASGSGSNQNGTGSLIGGLVGAGLGYLDSRNQPNSFTTTTQIDPRLAEFAYGPNGTAAMAQQAAAANGGQYLSSAGQQISQLGQQAPTNYNDLVKNNQSLWSANPFIDEQRKAIMDTLNTNFAQNTLPAIGGQANSNGGYGGSRQGIAQGLAINSMNQNAAPALANLASNAWQDSQNRAMQGAQYQGQYGLAGTAQQANLLGQGANMQAQAPWFNANQFGNLTRQLPGNSSVTQPLFNNTTAATIGGAQTGSQYGGNINWGQLAGTIGDWFK